MPAYTEEALGMVQLRDLVAYLETLRGAVEAGVSKDSR